MTRSNRKTTMTPSNRNYMRYHFYPGQQKAAHISYKEEPQRSLYSIDIHITGEFPGQACYNIFILACKIPNERSPHQMYTTEIVRLTG